MTMQTETTPPAPSAQLVGKAFVEQYYHILHHSPELVYRFYKESSMLSRPDPNGLLTTVTTRTSINNKICSLDYKNYKAEVKTVDAQNSFMEGVIVLVTGCLTGKDNLMRRKFTQTFFLAPQDMGYYVLNDVFRYVEESEADVVTEVATVVDDTPSAQLVGKIFVEKYYHILHILPEQVYWFYQESSMLSRPDPKGLLTTVTSMTSINNKICSSDYENYEAEIKTVDAQNSFMDGLIILVTGCLTGKDNLRRKFTQMFFLAPQDKGYYVLNDVLRYVEESEADAVAEVDTVADDTPSRTLTQKTVEESEADFERALHRLFLEE